MKRFEAQGHSRGLLQETSKGDNMWKSSNTLRTEEKTILKPTRFAFEGQDSLDSCLLIGTKISISIQQSDVVSGFNLLWR